MQTPHAARNSVSRSFEMSTMRDLLSLSLPFSTPSSSNKNKRIKPRRRLSNQQDTTAMNIFGSDICSIDFILDGLKAVKKDKAVDKVEIEDWVTSSHHQCLQPVVKALVASSGGRTWKQFRFVDSMDDVDEFRRWQRLKAAMMKDYEQTAFIRRSRYILNVLIWQANVMIHCGTSVETIQHLFESLQEKDHRICSLSFSGALYGYFAPFVPEELCNLIDKDSRQLTQDIIINIACGWLDDCRDWVELLNSCIGSLSSFIVAMDSNRKANHKKSSCDGRNNGEQDDLKSPVQKKAHDAKLVECIQDTTNIKDVKPTQAYKQQVPRAA